MPPGGYYGDSWDGPGNQIAGAADTGLYTLAGQAFGNPDASGDQSMSYFKLTPDMVARAQSQGMNITQLGDGSFGIASNDPNRSQFFPDVWHDSLIDKIANSVPFLAAGALGGAVAGGAEAAGGAGGADALSLGLDPITTGSQLTNYGAGTAAAGGAGDLVASGLDPVTTGEAISAPFTPATAGEMAAGGIPTTAEGLPGGGISPPGTPSVPGAPPAAPPGGTGAKGPLADIANVIGLLTGIKGLTSSPGTVSPSALTNAGTGVFNLAADPQNALHDRTQQQIQDAARASSSAHGVAMSPFAAGTENKAVSDFNIDWQNQQLQRMISALGAFTGASGGANAAAGVNTTNNANSIQAILAALTNMGSQPGSFVNNLFNGGSSAPAGGGTPAFYGAAP